MGTISTTVSYNNSTIATIQNATKILATSGRWMTDNITITDESAGGITPTGTINITTNGTHDVTQYASASVNVPTSSTPSLQSKTATYTPTTSEQTATITADSGYDGLSSVGITVNAMPGGSATTPATTITISPVITVNANGKIIVEASTSQNITPTVSAGYVSSGTAGRISVSGSSSTQLTTQAAKTVTPTESEQTAVASGVYTTGIVKVGAISSTYIGSDITQRDETDLTASGAVVTVPSGYYAEQETKSVTTTFHLEPTITLNSTTGLVTASHTQTAGYVSAGTTTGTLQLTTQAAKTVTPSETAQTAVAAGRYTTGAVTVGAISSTYVGSGITQCDSDDLTVSGATVTAPAGYYSAAASKSVASGTVTAPSSISGTSATVSTGTNTLTLTKTVSVTPSVTTAGYISAGTAGNSSVSLTASITTKAAATYYPSTTDQTISASQYLTGAQTIKAVTVSGLSAANIASGVTVKVGDSADDDRITSVTGTLAFSTITVSSSAPSGGSNGDVWIQTA